MSSLPNPLPESCSICQENDPKELCRPYTGSDISDTKACSAECVKYGGKGVMQNGICFCINTKYNPSDLATSPTCEPGTTTGPCAAPNATSDTLCETECAKFGSEGNVQRVGNKCYCLDPKDMRANGKLKSGSCMASKAATVRDCGGEANHCVSSSGGSHCLARPNDPTNSEAVNKYLNPQLDLSDTQKKQLNCACDEQYPLPHDQTILKKWQDAINTGGDDMISTFHASLGSNMTTQEKHAISDMMCRFTNKLSVRNKYTGVQLSDNPSLWLKQKLNSGFMRTLIILLIYGVLFHLLFRMIFPKRGKYQDSLAHAIWCPEQFLQGDIERKQLWTAGIFMILLVISLTSYGITEYRLSTNKETDPNKKEDQSIFRMIFTKAIPGTFDLGSKEFWVGNKSISQTWTLWLFGFILLGGGFARIANNNFILNFIAFLFTGLPMMIFAVFFILVNFVIGAIVPGAELLFIIFYRFGFGLFRAAKTQNSILKFPAELLMKILGIRDTDKWVMPFVPFVTHFVRLFYAVSGQRLPNYFKEDSGLTGVSNTDMWLS